MMTSSRSRDTGEIANRRGHGSQLSISDPSHHVTEAIGTLYGDSDDDSSHDSRRDSRPLSFIASPYGGEQIQKPLPHRTKPQAPTSHLPNQERLLQAEIGNISFSTASMLPPKDSIGKYTDRGTTNQLPNQKSSIASDATPQPLSPVSPSLSLRDVQSDNTNPSQFPITNIDNPDDIAQELSNLQALRRMSIDVGNTADPDLIPFQGLSLMSMPSIAPTGEDDEGDISRLLWVPAKVHPELAPDQFKTFLEKRVQSLKRRSADTLLPVDVQNEGAIGLQRKKSMLSRQIDTNSKHSSGRGSTGKNDPSNQQLSGSAYATTELSLNELVMDPSKAVQRLAMDTQRQTESSSPEVNTLDDDKPILPVPTMGLRRSTHTQYRKGGSLRSGSRQVSSKRAAALQAAEKDTEKGSDGTKETFSDAHLGYTLQRIQSEPVPTMGFTQVLPRHPPTIQKSGAIGVVISDAQPDSLDVSASSVLTEKSATKATNLSDSSTAIIEHPTYTASDSPREALVMEPRQQFPQRSSSQSTASLQPPMEPTQQQYSEANGQDIPPSRSNKSPSDGRTMAQPSIQLAITTPAEKSIPSHVNKLDNLASTTARGSLVEERRTEKRAKDKEESDGNKSMSWKWFKSDDKDKKKKEKGKEERVKSRARSLDKTHDRARLDVLQSSIDNGTQKGREGFVLDRDGIEVKLRDDRKREARDTIRKSTDGKREKDGFLVSIFGGSRKKEGRDNSSVKGKQRSPSPEPTVIILRPDIDYPYTRFPIVEERAIYRMAHIKLANPRRDLRSQVLLSNFMYSYLAKVQAMHPQLNVPTSPQQKRKEEERKRREQDLQQQFFAEQQVEMQNSVDQYGFEYHKAEIPYEDASHHGHQDGTNDYGNLQSLDQAQEDNQGQPSLIARQKGRDEDESVAGQIKASQGYYDYGQSDSSQHNATGIW